MGLFGRRDKQERRYLPYALDDLVDGRQVIVTSEQPAKAAILKVVVNEPDGQREGVMIMVNGAIVKTTLAAELRDPDSRRIMPDPSRRVRY